MAAPRSAPDDDRWVADAGIDIAGGTPRSLVRPDVDPATFVLPPAAARAVRAFDLRVDAWFDHLRQRPAVDRVLYAASALGDYSLVWHLVGTTQALGGRNRQQESVRLAVALGVESIMVNGLVKGLFRRARPAWEQPRTRPLRRPRSSSFPSGHATSGFMAATLLSAGRPRTRPLWFGLATVVAASRVHVRIHHASDVAAGAVMGVGLGRLVGRLWQLPRGE